MLDIPPQLAAAARVLGEEQRTALLSVLVLPDEARAKRIGELYSDPPTRTMAEFLIDLEADPMAKALVIAAIRR